MSDIEYMHRALELAEKGVGFVGPNPMVGAVIVKDGNIIGEGYHEKYGGFHAERNALANCKESAEGATLYVNLEPCCHYGKTPPCTEAILESGISKVVVACVDPNPLMAGKGIGLLRSRGLEVVVGVLEEESHKFNEVFFHYIQAKTPFVVMKYAMTMDGKIATYSGKSKWITGEAARHKVHEDRFRYSAIMVGVGTVLADDPMLDCRLDIEHRTPVRIVCDTQLRTPLDARIVKTAKKIPTMIATACTEPDRQNPYIEAGCEVLTISQKDGHLDLTELMEKLGGEIDSILLEGGSTLNWSALQSGIVNKAQTYIAPKIFGGENAKTPVAGMGVESPDKAFFLTNSKVSFYGEDILIESEVKPCSQES